MQNSKNITTTALELALVPEHSIYFMQSISGGKAFIQDEYLCYSPFISHSSSIDLSQNDNWITFIGYPLKGEYSDENFLKAKDNAMKACDAKTCYIVAPKLPSCYKNFVLEEDYFYTLSLNNNKHIPKKLENPIEKANKLLTVELGTTFTHEHRRLWTEFMTRVPLKEMVKRLFISTISLFNQENKVKELFLLNAWDKNKKLVACLLLDFAPQKFCSYILGAHSKDFYVSHAVDLLFAKMIEISKEKKKEYIHLGLGVNSGITRFKLKWGAEKSMPFIMATLKKENESFKFHTQTLLSALVSNEHNTNLLEIINRPKWQVIVNLPEQKPYAMLWELEKNGKKSWIGGSAHFFCYSFERSFRKLFNKADTILFEGPLDEYSLKLVSENGREINDEHKPLFDRFTKEEIKKLSRMVRGAEGFLPRLLNMEAKRKLDVEWYLKNTRAWTALFSLWTAFLERNSWSQSVDMEAWNLAHDMNKRVIAMESIEEQIASLNSVPPERVVRYFQNCHKWPAMIKENVKAYLSGNLQRQMGTSAEFPTRTKTIISMRDERFRQRMRPFIEQGRCVVFVGTAHMLNLTTMLIEDGFNIKKITI